MTSFTGQLLLESVLVPAAVSGPIALLTRWFDRRVFLVPIYAAAFFLALASSYVMVFGWPATLVFGAIGARQKVALLATAGLLIGLILAFTKMRALSASLPIALLITGPIWIGWPALMQGRADALLLILPLIIAPLLAGYRAGSWSDARPGSSGGVEPEWPMLMIIMAVGVALVALFARNLSIMQLSLALTSTLAAIFILGRRPLPPVLLAPSALMLSGFLTTLLLYSDASLPAIIILAGIPVLPHLKGLFSSLGKAGTPSFRSYGTALTLTTAAAITAWIDAGSFSVY